MTLKRKYISRAACPSRRWPTAETARSPSAPSSPWDSPIRVPAADAAARHRALLTRLTEAVAGQEQAVEQLANTLRRLHTGLSDPDRPAGVLLLAGPAGTGKRRMAEALAEVLAGRTR